jgi:hypothetical protein
MASGTSLPTAWKRPKSPTPVLCKLRSLGQALKAASGYTSGNLSLAMAALGGLGGSQPASAGPNSIPVDWTSLTCSGSLGPWWAGAQ